MIFVRIGGPGCFKKKMKFCPDWLLAFRQIFDKIRLDSSQGSPTITWGPSTHRTGTTFRSVTTVTVMHLDSAWQRSTRTPENALRTLVRKPQIFIRTVLANFYPETGFGSWLSQFLLGRRIWLNFFSLDTIPELSYLRFMYHASFIWDITVICHCLKVVV